jgi:hypothetical protein
MLKVRFVLDPSQIEVVPLMLAELGPGDTFTVAVVEKLLVAQPFESVSAVML